MNVLRSFFVYNLFKKLSLIFLVLTVKDKFFVDISFEIRTLHKGSAKILALLNWLSGVKDNTILV